MLYTAWFSASGHHLTTIFHMSFLAALHFLHPLYNLACDLLLQVCRCGDNEAVVCSVFV